MVKNGWRASKNTFLGTVAFPFGSVPSGRVILLDPWVNFLMGTPIRGGGGGVIWDSTGVLAVGDNPGLRQNQPHPLIFSSTATFHEFGLSPLPHHFNDVFAGLAFSGANLQSI